MMNTALTAQQKRCTKLTVANIPLSQVLQKTVGKPGHLRQHLPVGNARKGDEKQQEQERPGLCCGL